MTVYIYEESFDGFLTAIYRAFYAQTSEIDFVGQHHEVATLYEKVYMETQFDQAQKVRDAIEGKLSMQVYDQVYLAWLSHKDEIERAIFLFLKVAFRFGDKILHMLQDPNVHQVMTAAKATANEAHRYLGLLRFRLMHGGYVADIEPKYEILPLITSHFVSRFADQDFVIRDRSYGQALLYLKRQIAILPMKEFVELSETEDPFEDMWKAYYQKAAIQSRINPKRMQSHMPKYTWKYMIEKQEERG